MGMARCKMELERCKMEPEHYMMELVHCKMELHTRLEHCSQMFPGCRPD